MGGGGGNQDPGDPRVGKVREGKDFFSFKQGGGLTLDDTMVPLDGPTHTIEKIRLILANFSYSNDIVQKVKY